MKNNITLLLIKIQEGAKQHLLIKMKQRLTKQLKYLFIGVKEISEGSPLKVEGPTRGRAF